MSSFTLKVTAVVSMVIDHVGVAFFPEHEIFRIVGRVAFPLFAFFIAEGFVKTSHKGEYLLRLTAFALISQLPFSVFAYSVGGVPEPLNIFFSLALGLSALIVLTRVRNIFGRIFLFLLFVLIASSGLFSYSLYGFFSILAGYLVIKKKRAGLFLFILFPFLETLGQLALYGAPGIQLYATMTVPLIATYDGSRGRKVSRWWFYWFYPVHLSIIAGILIARFYFQ